MVPEGKWGRKEASFTCCLANEKREEIDVDFQVCDTTRREAQECTHRQQVRLTGNGGSSPLDLREGIKLGPCVSKILLVLLLGGQFSLGVSLCSLRDHLSRVVFPIGRGGGGGALQSEDHEG